MEEELKDIHNEAHRYLEQKKKLVKEASKTVVDALTYKYKRLAKPLMEQVDKNIKANFKFVKEQIDNIVECKKHQFFTANGYFSEEFDTVFTEHFLKLGLGTTTPYDKPNNEPNSQLLETMH